MNNKLLLTSNFWQRTDEPYLSWVKNCGLEGLYLIKKHNLNLSNGGKHSPGLQDWSKAQQTDKASTQAT